MKRAIFQDVASAAKGAASTIAAEARAAIAARGRFTLAVSGGHTPWLMLRELANKDVPWAGVHIFQVDERVAPEGHPDRNLALLRESLLQRVPLPAGHVHAMPVESADLEAAAAAYSLELRKTAGSPAVLDLVHLGLGPDGHTASLTPGDPVLQVTNTDVAPTEEYQGRRRMTLTYPALDRARQVLWVVTGVAKVEMLRRLYNGDRSIPAGCIRQDNALLIADRAAVGHRSAEQHTGACDARRHCDGPRRVRPERNSVPSCP